MSLFTFSGFIELTECLVQKVKLMQNEFRSSSIAGFYGVYSVYNVNLEIGKLEVPGKFINYASCGDDQ